MFAKFEKEQWELYHKQLRQNDPNYIKVPKWVEGKMKHLQRVMRLKGKMMKIIINQQKQEGIKRKRLEAFREEVQLDNIRDQVWVPPANLQSEEPIPVDKL